MRHSFLLLLIFTFSINIVGAETVQLYLGDVDRFQDDTWSCGVHSAYRILKGGYGQSVDYGEMCSTITENKPFRVVLIQDVVEFDLAFGSVKIGQPSTVLAGSLRNHYHNSTILKTSNDIEILKEILWQGKPVMILIQVGCAGLGEIKGCIGLEIGDTCIGTRYSVNGNWPTLHWLVAVGYDDNYLYYKNTDSNHTYVFPWADFARPRKWNTAGCRYNRDIANLIKSKGTKPGNMIYFDEPLPPNRIARTGFRHPEELAAAVSVINSLLLDPEPPTVNVKAPDAKASEPGTNRGRVEFTRTGDTSEELTVKYTVSGTAQAGNDYKTLSGTVTIPTGQTFVTLRVVPLDDKIVEAAETVIVKLAADPAYKLGTPESAKVTIADNE